MSDHDDGQLVDVLEEDTNDVMAIEKYQQKSGVEIVGIQHSLAYDPYIGVAAMPFDEQAQSVLAKYQDVPDEFLDIKPSGQLYLSHIHARHILNEAFGFGGWALVPVGEFAVERVPMKDKAAERVNVYRNYRLYVLGRYHDEAMGAGTYYTNNADADYSDACESAKSYALNRLCKTFNVARRCWDKAFGEQWKASYAVQEGGKWKRRPVKSSPVTTQPKSALPVEPPVAPVEPAPEPPQRTDTADLPFASVRMGSLSAELIGANKSPYRKLKAVNGATYIVRHKTHIAALLEAPPESPLLLRYSESTNARGDTFMQVEDLEVVVL